MLPVENYRSDDSSNPGAHRKRRRIDRIRGRKICAIRDILGVLGGWVVDWGTRRLGDCRRVPPTVLTGGADGTPKMGGGCGAGKFSKWTEAYSTSLSNVDFWGPGHKHVRGARKMNVCGRNEALATAPVRSFLQDAALLTPN